MQGSEADGTDHERCENSGEARRLSGIRLQGDEQVRVVDREDRSRARPEARASGRAEEGPEDRRPRRRLRKPPPPPPPPPEPPDFLGDFVGTYSGILVGDPGCPDIAISGIAEVIVEQLGTTSYDVRFGLENAHVVTTEGCMELGRRNRSGSSRRRRPVPALHNRALPPRSPAKSSAEPSRHARARSPSRSPAPTETRHRAGTKRVRAHP